MRAADRPATDRDAARARWRAVHRAGDRNEPIRLSEPYRPFWVSNWKLDRAPRDRHRLAPVAVARMLALAGCAAAWAVILWL